MPLSQGYCDLTGLAAFASTNILSGIGERDRDRERERDWERKRERDIETET